MGTRAIKAGQPAVVILGGTLSGRNVWSEIGWQLGLGDVGSEEMLSPMQAAAEASNAPFLLLLDALNEAADAAAWRTELPRLLAEVAQNPWISVAVSVRSAFLPVVLPPDGLGDVTQVEHPGFDGRELEATERPLLDGRRRRCGRDWYRACLRSLKPNVIRNINCYIWTVTITDHSVSGLRRRKSGPRGRGFRVGGLQ